MSSASTGGTEGSSPASSPASATSLTMAAPKYGTLVPNRIFVGGISANTSVEELAQLFSSYGNVKATKIIADRAGVSKGYGFVTFETEEEAKRLQQESECIVLRERKLNIAPAIKKQPFNRSFDGGSGSPPSVPTSTYYFANGMGLTYQNGMTFYNTTAPTPTTPIAPPTDPATIYQATGVFGPQAAGHQTFAPVMYPCPAPSLYMPQQYPYSPMPYEYYAGAASAGASPYLYQTNNSQNNTSGGNSNSGSGNNGTGATSPPTGPPAPLPSLPPPPAHFYTPAAPPTHHHPPVPAGPPPPQDHLWYSFTAGSHPPLPPHAPMGLTGDQQLLLYPPDATCQQTSSSDGQTAPQEDSRSTSSHSEQTHGEAQAASGSATPLVSLMPVKFPMSGRYTNFHPIAIHTANLYSSQSCLNETDDCAGNQMHCRAIVYHPATVYIPHTHNPTFHNASGSASLLPTPVSSVSQQLFDSGHNAKGQCYSSKDYAKSAAPNGPTSHAKSHSQHGFAFSQQQTNNPYARGQNSYRHNADGGYSNKYMPAAAMNSRFSAQYNKRTGGSSVGSPACFVAQKSSDYCNPSFAQKSSGSYAANSYSIVNAQKFNSSLSFDYANSRRMNTGDHPYLDKSASYSARRNYRNSGATNGAAGQIETGGSISQSSEIETNANTQQGTTSTATVTTSTTTTTTTVTATETEDSSNSEKPVSPPPAPYSPMTRPLPTLSPPTSQVQFYAPNRYQPSLAPSQHQHQQQQQQQQQSSSTNAQRRYTMAPTLSASRKTTEKYSTSGSQPNTTTMLRQSKYKVNGIMQTGGKVTDDNLGGAGDAPPGVGRMPLTPPGTPRTHPGHPAGDQNQLSDTCHQMQALTL